MNFNEDRINIAIEKETNKNASFICKNSSIDRCDY